MMYNERRKVRNIRTSLAVSAVLIILCVCSMADGIGISQVYGAQKRTVKVGFFPMEGYNEKNEDGTYGGMDVEYLETLCDYVNWEVEYVECDSWDAALQLLADRKIDLVGSAQFSSERAEIYQYANLASGYTFGTIAVNGGSSLPYEDFGAMEQITYGVVKTYIRKAEFYEYLSDHGIRNPVVKEYDNTAELQAALAEQQIDAMVHSLTEIREGQRIIGRFAPMPIYYISYKGNDEVMRELNQGIADIKMKRPDLENELIAKYYDSRLDQTILLSQEEKDYIEEKKNITVGYFDGYYPFSYENEGTYHGLTKHVLDETAVLTGLTFTYVKMTNMDEAKQALKDGRIDLLNYCGDTPKSMRNSGVVVTKAYAKVPHVVIMDRDSTANEIKVLAAVKNGNEEENIAALVNEDAQILIFDSQLECLYAVNEGEADAAICDGYLSEYLLGSNLRLNKLEIRSVLNDAHVIYMAVRDDADSPLLSILNKELPEVSDKMVNDYMLRDNLFARNSVENFIRSHSVLIVAIVIVIAVCIVLVMLHMLRDSRRIQKLMYKDPELNIWNLNYLKYRAQQKLAADRNQKYAVVYMDVCQFRRYNTLYGWHAGQKILELIVRMLAEDIDNDKELYARSQGDHFVLFVRYDSLSELEIRLAGLEDKITQRIYEMADMRMPITMGVCCIPSGSDDMQVSISYAVQASDLLKNSYSNEIRIYDENLRVQLKENHDREKLLESVDINKDFVAYYQPKVDIRSEQIVGAEALVRFKDPTDNGAIRAPGYFVPYFEQTGRITEIDFFVMECACKLLRRRMDAGKRIVPISCNFSRIHFTRENFPEQFEAVMDKYQIPKEYIEVEITETLVVEELQQHKVKETVEILRKKGIRLSIDDFGSGYSSLGVFEQIPASVIKLDRSFLLNNENRLRQVKIMKNIVNLAQDLDAQVVCEGVENENDTELMMEIGAYVAQGYRYSKPVPEEVFEEKLDKKQI
ncbi:MAG: EAL domain-containing protein [Lachnospiraceae bacterium]|nr:EAL domain-containing protein [Lachnospiraceae bacterium]